MSIVDMESMTLLVKITILRGTTGDFHLLSEGHPTLLDFPGHLTFSAICHVFSMIGNDFTGFPGCVGLLVVQVFGPCNPESHPAAKSKGTFNAFLLGQMF